MGVIGSKHSQLFDLIFCNDEYEAANVSIALYLQEHPDAINCEFIGEDYDLVETYIYTPLMLACIFSQAKHKTHGTSHMSIAETLIKCGADVNYLHPVRYTNRCYNRITPLMSIIQLPSLDNFNFLIDHGADININCYKHCIYGKQGIEYNILERIIDLDIAPDKFKYVYQLYIKGKGNELDICTKLLSHVRKQALTQYRRGAKIFLKSQIKKIN